ncbi:DUF2892 domain-containing protein [Stappia sp. BW2]|uniref:YgaP family membrane protein n=1 Tax=Stappia sp. BW2 TaxID=2592622 RepID=UPI002570991A|nr:DUF2892 domain-containing protein [Stappia sp. BW2]
MVGDQVTQYRLLGMRLFASSHSIKEQNMKRNMGTIDRGIRVFVAIILLGISFGSAFASSGVLHWVLIAVALVFLLTAAVGNCPLYSLIGIRTCRAS